MLGACGWFGSDDPDHTLTGLARTGDACPFDLEGAMVDAGLDPDPGPTHVQVMEGTGEGGFDGPPIETFSGVWVECSHPTAGGEATAVLYAIDDHGQAVSLLLPLMARDLDLSTMELEQTFDVVTRTHEGDLADLPTDGPGAVASVSVGGAQSAVLYVFSDQATLDQASSVAGALIAEF
jgi:hypothetical protein